MNITILGAGAIGSLWAHHLVNAGHNLSLWTRNPESSRFDLTLDQQTPKQFITNSVVQLKKSELLLVTVKAWQVKAAIDPLIKHLSPDTIIMFMHNGLGAIEEISADMTAHPVVMATTTHGAYKSTKNTFQHTGLGTTTLGGYNQLGHRCHFLSDVFDHALPSVGWSDAINKPLWEKLAINCVINPLTALNQCLNGDLAQEKYTSTIEQLIDEVCAVAKTKDINLSTEELSGSVNKVISATANNHSSMQQDIAQQRKTEIEYITGYLLAQAKIHKITAPANQALYEKIKTIEQSWSDHDS